MESGSYYGSPNGERVSEWPSRRKRRLAVNQFGRTPMRRFESCLSHNRKPDGRNDLPSTPNWQDTGLLSRTELVRVRPTATNHLGRGQKL